MENTGHIVVCASHYIARGRKLLRKPLHSCGCLGPREMWGAEGVICRPTAMSVHQFIFVCCFDITRPTYRRHWQITLQCVCSADRRRWCIRWWICSHVRCWRYTGWPSGHCCPSCQSTYSCTYTPRRRSESVDQRSNGTCSTAGFPLHKIQPYIICHLLSCQIRAVVTNIISNIRGNTPNEWSKCQQCMSFVVILQNLVAIMSYHVGVCLGPKNLATFRTVAGVP